MVRANRSAHGPVPCAVSQAGGLLMRSDHGAPAWACLAIAATAFGSAAAAAADLSGRVLGGGVAIEGSAVSLVEATAGAPKQLATATTAADGGFTPSVPDDRAAGASLYLVARGGKPTTGAENPAIALLAVLGPETQ